MPISAKTTWEDPLTFKTMSKGDRVTVSTMNGIATDFILQEINEGGLFLVPPSEYHRSSKTHATPLILASSINLKNFKAKPKEEVTVYNKDGQSTKLKILFVPYGRGLILYDPKLSAPWPLRYLFKLLK
nr:hypothetical protein BdHM001_10100 [Bdellovibrio sp. HM001]